MRVLLPSLLGVLTAMGGAVLLNPPTHTNESPERSEALLPVNPVLGNESFRSIFGTTPSPNPPERLRLQTHLAYVEGRLRARPPSWLSPAQRARRSHLLDALRDYWTRGVFPRNTEAPGRRPVFIDADGRLCAVGHLITVSAGRTLAEEIDRQYHFADVHSMEIPALDRWANRHGFTRRELAMIQPTYCAGCVPPIEDDSDASALEVTALSASVGASILNGTLLERDAASVVSGTAGVLAGGTSLTIGLTDGAAYPTASSLIGTTSLVLGGWGVLSALQNRGDPKAQPLSSGGAWQIRPALASPSGSIRPGLHATLRF